MKELATALVKAQAEMENASKDATNPHFNKKYADLTSVLEAIKPSLAKYGLGFVQVCHDAPDCAKVETVIVHESGEQFSCGTISVPVSKGDAQGYGSALTYARRYSLATAFGVGAEDDDGNAAAKAAPVKESAKSIGKADFDKLPKDRQESLTEVAKEIEASYYENGSLRAYELYTQAKEGLPVEEQTALRGLLKSEIRTAFTKIFNGLQKEAA